MEDLSKIYNQLIKSDPQISEALRIASLNSTNKPYWIIGGSVYRLLNKYLHNVPIKSTLKTFMDIDILFENLRKDVIANGYELSRTSFGEPRLRKGNTQLDLIHLSNTTYIKRNNLEPTLENFLEGNFIDIQSVAFNPINKKLTGIGIQALTKRKGKVINQQELENYCRMKNITPNEYIAQLSESLDMEITIE